MLVLDECFSGLDKKKIEAIFAELRKERMKKTILVVSHSKLVLNLCDASYVLSARKLRKFK
jgi:ABC-type bacteriocin/lantibiotic exporter with double-glycine peptidase domain